MPLTTSVPEQVLETVRKSQDATLDALRSWAEAVEQSVPKAGALPTPDHMPEPAAVVNSVFDFASELLRVQRDLAHKLLAAAGGDAAAPVSGSATD